MHSLTVMIVAERGSPDIKAISPNQSRGAENGDDFGIARAAVDDDLHRAGLDQVKSIALLALREDGRVSGKNDLFHLAQDLGDILARERGENGNTSNDVGERFHQQIAINELLCSLSLRSPAAGGNR